MKKSILTISLLSVLLLAGCGNQAAKAGNSSSNSSSSKVVSNKKTHTTTKPTDKKANASSSSEVASSSSIVSASSSTSSTVASSSSEAAPSSQENNAALAKQYLTGKGFRISPVLYDGEDIDQAMDDQKAPTNVVTDYTVSFYFNDATTATSTHTGQLRPDSSNYTVSENTITVGSYQIPYSISNGTVVFSQWSAADGQRGTITYQISPSDYTGGSTNASN